MLTPLLPSILLSLVASYYTSTHANAHAIGTNLNLYPTIPFAATLPPFYRIPISFYTHALLNAMLLLPNLTLYLILYLLLYQTQSHAITTSTLHSTLTFLTSYYTIDT